MFSMWSVQDSWSNDLVSAVHFNSAWEAVKIELEPVKLKALHCYKQLPGNG
jgi:hypothetical protein